MKVLVANLGSTSFKYRLYDMEGERQLARGGIERIGASESRAAVEIGSWQQELSVQAPDHVAAVSLCLEQLTDPQHGCLADRGDVAAIGFKAVHGGRFSGVQLVDADVLQAMQDMGEVAPAHNPPYLAAMRQLHQQLPEIPLVAAFETGFHETIPPRLRTYAVPQAWCEEYGVRRWGFHGASHRYISQRTAELLGRHDLRVISCHLGGSSSLCAIRHGQSLATSMGMSPQSGLPQNNRCGDFDPFAVRFVMQRTGRTHDAILADLSERSGLAGLSQTSGDLRDVAAAAASGNEQAQLALDVYVTAARHYLGAYLVELGGADLIAFTGGIGQHSPMIRSRICADLDGLGIVLDDDRNNVAEGEVAIHSPSSVSQIWIVPTNEEIIVARQVAQLLQAN